MKTLKLEVGKSYINRKGEEVRIIEKRVVGEYPYQFKGSNGEWYAESGRFDYYEEVDIDLIEELPETRHTFAIPDGVKKVTVEQVGNRIVVEMVPGKEPKPGDVMINKWRSVYIFKSIDGNGGHDYSAWLGSRGRLAYNGLAMPGRPATPEEAQPLWDALQKAGKRWNAETMEVEDVPESTRIREWMDMNIKCGGEVVDIAEVIERYLKHREGKND